MENSVQVQYRLGFGTQFWASQVVFAQSGAGRFIYVVFVGIPLLGLITLPMTGVLASQPGNWFVPFLIMPGIALLFFPLITALSIWRARQRNTWFRGVLRLVISPDAFEAHGDGFDTRLRWDVIQRVVETGGFFLFYVSPVLAHIVPKACVASPTDVSEIRQIVHEALGPKAKLRRA